MASTFVRQFCLRDLKFVQSCDWGSHSSRKWCPVGWAVLDTQKDLLFWSSRVSTQKMFFLGLLAVNNFLLHRLHIEDEDNKILLNVRNQSRDCTAWDPRGLGILFYFFTELFRTMSKAILSLHIAVGGCSLCVKQRLFLVLHLWHYTVTHTDHLVRRMTHRLRISFISVLLHLAAAKPFCHCDQLAAFVNYLVVSGIHTRVHCLVWY
jgi:hypothetical protein